MVYYPLQLLQRVGVRDVLLVTGKQHAGDFIDLLGDGRLRTRSGDEPLFDVDLTYKVQVEPGGIAQVVGMARDFARGEKLVVCLGDNIFEYAQAERDRRLGRAARSPSSARCPTPRASASSPTTRTAASPTSSRRPASSTCATPSRPRTTRSSASTAFRPRCSRSSTRSSRRAAASWRSPTSTASSCAADELKVERVEGWWHDGGKHWADLADVGRKIERDRASTSDGWRRQRFPLTRHEDERGWFQELGRSSALPKPMRQANLAWSRKGVIRGLHFHERGQDDLFTCLQGMVRVVVLDRETGETFTEDIGDDNPVAIYVPGHRAHGYEALTDGLFCYLVTEEYDPRDPDEHGVPWNDPRVVDLWSTRSPLLSERDTDAAS